MTIKKTLQGMQRESNMNWALGIVTVAVIALVMFLCWVPNG